jgi:hypothetical protein
MDMPEKYTFNTRIKKLDYEGIYCENLPDKIRFDVHEANISFDVPIGYKPFNLYEDKKSKIYRYFLVLRKKEDFTIYIGNHGELEHFCVMDHEISKSKKLRGWSGAGAIFLSELEFLDRYSRCWSITTKEMSEHTVSDGGNPDRIILNKNGKEKSLEELF